MSVLHRPYYGSGRSGLFARRPVARDGGRQRPRAVVGGVHREVNQRNGGPGALVSFEMEPAPRAPRPSCCRQGGCISRGHENSERRRPRGHQGFAGGRGRRGGHRAAPGRGGCWCLVDATAGALHYRQMCVSRPSADGGLACEGRLPRDGVARRHRVDAVRRASLFSEIFPGTPQKGRQGGPDPELCLSPVQALFICCFENYGPLVPPCEAGAREDVAIGMQVDLLSGHPSRWGPLCGRESGSAAVLARPGSGGAGPSHAQISRQSTQGGNVPS
mmetsp:Transcript_23647/g.66384  ORF Transcript_23647/g.66384 Transcript_23647/m.66384 type:complete len:274 (-) Transcript_23647:252-1073(-)